MTDYTAGGLTAPVDWSRQHEPWTDEDPSVNGPAQNCANYVRVEDGAFELVGDAAKPFFCWESSSTEWAEPTPTDFG
jgi:hypothetical protein